MYYIHTIIKLNRFYTNIMNDDYIYDSFVQMATFESFFYRGKKI